MAFGNFSSVLKIFGGSSASEEIQDELYKDVLLMTLAQASKADANIHPLEIETIQQIMRRETGQDLTEADIRKAARPDLYQSANLRKFLRRAQGQLNAQNKTTILQALVDVIKSDTKINVLEIDFFNRVVDALRMTPAEQFGLTA
ncbi:MAG: TerB family tellurite resistance protein [Nitrosomonadaceae bacterium]